MKFKKGDKVIVLDGAHTPNDLIGKRVKILIADENSRTYRCENKKHEVYWLNEYNIELPKILKLISRYECKIEKLKQKISKLKR